MFFRSTAIRCKILYIVHYKYAIKEYMHIKYFKAPYNLPFMPTSSDFSGNMR